MIHFKNVFIFIIISVFFSYFMMIIGYLFDSKILGILGIPINFSEKLGPGIAGAGFDVIIGAFSGWIAANMTISRDNNKKLLFLDWKRSTDKSVLLSEITSNFSEKLPLYNLEFKKEKIIDIFINNSKFYGSIFKSVEIINSKFSYCLFGKEPEKSKFNNCFFKKCIFQKCYFNNCIFTNDGGSFTFNECSFYNCDFKNSYFIGVDFNTSNLYKCRFWGASFDKNSRLTKDYYSFFEKNNSIRRNNDGGFSVVSRYEYLKYKFKSCFIN